MYRIGHSVAPDQHSHLQDGGDLVHFGDSDRTQPGATWLATVARRAAVFDRVACQSK